MFNDNQLKEIPCLEGFTSLQRLDFSYNEVCLGAHPKRFRRVCICLRPSACVSLLHQGSGLH